MTLVHMPTKNRSSHAKREEMVEGLFNALYHEANDTTFGLGVWASAVTCGKDISFHSEDEAIEWLLRVCPSSREVVTLALTERGGDVVETYMALMDGLM
jgi:hypothetical protein